MKTLCLLIFSLGVVMPRLAAADIHILIDQPEDQRFPIAVANIIKGPGYDGGSAILRKIPEVIRNDLQLSGYFYVIKPSIYSDRSQAVTSGAMPWGQWDEIGARAVVKGIATTEGGRTIIELRLFEVSGRRMQMGKQYTFDRADWRRIAHRFSDEVMLSATGTRGPFSTQIAYTLLGKRSKRSPRKQIDVMDMDGFNVRRLTKDRSLNLGPAWSPDGNQVAYVSYVGGFPDIYVSDLATGRRRRLTSNRSTNITPTYSPDGGTIAYSSGVGRDMEIYLMNNIGSDARPFSPAFGIDLAPSFSPDGSALIFASERGGRLHLYKKSVHGNEAATRLTFSGYQNDSPDWSPDSTKVAFTRFEGGKYDIYTINTDGSGLSRLTSFGSNEHPRWSPDSRFITYSATLARKSQIYMMRWDGANKTILTKGKDAALPDWGPWPAEYWN